MWNDSQGLSALSALTAWWSPGGNTKGTSADDLAQQLEAGEAPAILDVRSIAEFQAGHIPGAVNIPYREIVARAAEIPGADGEELIVYCAVGPRAVWAVKSLASVCRRELILLEGHFGRWKKSGHPIDV